MGLDLGSGMSVDVKRFAPRELLPAHAHPNAYCCLLLSGAALEEVEGNQIELKDSSFSVRLPGATHSVRFGSKPASAVIIEMDPGLVEQFRGEDCLPLPGVWKAPAAACVAAARIAYEIAANSLGARLIVEGLALQLIGLAIRDLPLEEGPRPPRWLRLAHDQMMEDPQGIRTISELAERAGVHPTHFSSSFRKWYRVSPTEFARRLRIEAAIELIKTTDLALTEIATRAGYYDQSHFTNEFKKRCGITPGGYRRALRQ
jgi:AraC-like DNA-binding protein/quercetin dioxygenase-like cupin family protein